MVTTQCQWDQCSNTGTARGTITFPIRVISEPGPSLSTTIKSLNLVLCDTHFPLWNESMMNSLSIAAIASAT